MRQTLSKLFFLSFIFSLYLLTSCSTSARFTTLNRQGEDALKAGNTKEALALFDESIKAYESSGKAKECPVYTEAAFAAMKLGDTSQALGYLEKAKYTASENEECRYGLALCYRHIDNLSKEMDALQTYREKYPKGENIARVNRRLFSVYVESENDEKAVALWNDLTPNQKSEPSALSEYFTVNKRMNNSAVCDSLATILLQHNKNQVQALEWKAKKYYDRAENLYQKEMKAYKQHKTRRQYAHLLKQLDKVTADFKKSLAFYKKLYALNPEEKYARKLANIYYRLDDKKKAEYYRNKL